MKRIRLLLVSAALAGCGGGQPSEQPSPDPSAIVLKGSEMSGSILDAMRGRVPGIRIGTDTGNCPTIMFRGPRSVRFQGNPSIYVDGTLMVDTCILMQINSTDVDRVEIFPSGNVSAPGIRQNPFGVIAIYRIRN